MKTKNYLSIISILFFSFLFVSCSKEDEGDTIKPVIDLLEPEEGAILRIGSSHGVHFEMNLHDNEAIASYKINIHNNFDGHSHTRASEAVFADVGVTLLAVLNAVRASNRRF